MFACWCLLTLWLGHSVRDEVYVLISGRRYAVWTLNSSQVRLTSISILSIFPVFMLLTTMVHISFVDLWHIIMIS